MVFQMAPNTEALTELPVWLPDFNALCAAEDPTHNLHNLHGTLVRDPHGWSQDGPAAWNEELSIDVVLADTDERYRLRLTNGVLTYTAAPQKQPADATITTTRRALPVLALGGLSPDRLADAGIELSGDAAVLGRLVAVLDPGDKNFAVVTP